MSVPSSRISSVKRKSPFARSPEKNATTRNSRSCVSCLTRPVPRSCSMQPVTPASRMWTPASYTRRNAWREMLCCQALYELPVKQPESRGAMSLRDVFFTGTRPDGRGFTENDSPNFSFRTNNCSFYSGTKALGEECLQDAENTYIWRLRIPFNHVDSPRNYLSKLLNYAWLLMQLTQSHT